MSDRLKLCRVRLAILPTNSKPIWNAPERGGGRPACRGGLRHEPRFLMSGLPPGFLGHSARTPHSLCRGPHLIIRRKATDSDQHQPWGAHIASPEGPSGAPVCALANWFFPYFGPWTRNLSPKRRKATEPDNPVADEVMRRMVPFAHNLKRKYFPKNAGISEQCRNMVRNAAKNSITFAAFCAAIPQLVPTCRCRWSAPDRCPSGRTARPEGPRATAPLLK
jgi:hypothetical protein